MSADAAEPSPHPSQVLAGSDLAASLIAMAQLASNRLSLEDLLSRVAGYGVQAIPQAEGAGLTLLEEDRSDTMAATARFVEEVDAVQYAMGQGPCLTALATSQTVLSDSLGADARWPRFGGRVARLSVHSVLSLPLITQDGLVGAMTFYARPKKAFDESAVQIGEAFAVPAAVTVQNAHVLAQTRRLIARLQSAVDDRAVIERAVGILMSRSGGTDEDALQRMRSLSQSEHIKLSVVAHRIVDEAVRRAQARHRGPGHTLPDAHIAGGVPSP